MLSATQSDPPHAAHAAHAAHRCMKSRNGNVYVYPPHAAHSFIKPTPTFFIHAAWHLVHERQGYQAKGMVPHMLDHTSCSLSNQAQPCPCILHGVYYLKDRYTWAKVWRVPVQHTQHARVVLRSIARTHPPLYPAHISMGRHGSARGRHARIWTYIWTKQRQPPRRRISSPRLP